MERNRFFPTGEDEHEAITPLEMTAIPETPVDLSQVWTTRLQTPAEAEMGVGTFSDVWGGERPSESRARFNTLAPILEVADVSQAWTTPLPKIVATEIMLDISTAVTGEMLRSTISQAETMPMQKLATPEIATDVTQGATIPLRRLTEPNEPKLDNDLSQTVTTRLSESLLKSKKTTSLNITYTSLIALLLLGILGSLFSFAGYSIYSTYSGEYHQYLSYAQAGIQHLQTAESLLAALPHNPLDANSVVKAQKEFIAASNELVLLDNALKSVPNIDTYIPVYGEKLRAALEVLPVALEATQAGKIGCDVLNLLISRFHDPTNVNSQGLTMADMTTIRNDFQQVEAIFYQLIDQVNHLSPSDAQLDPRVGKLMTSFHTYLPAILSSLDDTDKLLAILPAILGIGKPSSYLIEVLDSTELRPGGGFIGNYGVLTLTNGRETDAHITDVDLLDRPFEAAGHVIPFPSAYQWFDISPGSWSLRDTNLDADFPTVARYSQQNYKREGGTGTFQGVMAITPVLIQQMLGITGPINVPEYHEIITAQNLIARIHYHQLAASEGVDTIVASDGKSSQRKHFTALLAEHFLDRIHELGSSALPKLVQLMISSLHTKDLQVYLNNSVAESYLQRFHIDASIQSPPGDSLFVVDANIAADKANPYIVDTLNDSVTIDSQGNAIHQTTLTYAWKIPGPVYGTGPYRDYIRIYAPPGSILHEESGFQSRGTSKAFGRTVWAGFFTLNFGQTRTITLQWSVPHAAIKGAHGWHYQYLLQRQAGTVWTIHLHLVLPACAMISNPSGALVYSHKVLSIPVNSLSQDTNLGVDYTC
ncbi:MAG TPA: DUF4012 domain-containing protein [Ktedonobacteraceae bacterium]|nr:DUF4012 domain-containing protein [Ktedonobacteraceae bacterium]